MLSEFRPHFLRFRSDGSPPSDHGLCFPLRWRSFPRPVGSILLMLLTLFLCTPQNFRIFCSIANLAFQAFVMYRNYCGISEKDAPPVRRGLLLFFSGASMAFPELSGACTVSSSRRRSRPQDNKNKGFQAVASGCNAAVCSQKPLFILLINTASTNPDYLAYLQVCDGVPTNSPFPAI